MLPYPLALSQYKPRYTLPHPLLLLDGRTKPPPAKKKRVQTPAETISAPPEVLSPPTQEAESTAGDPPSHSEASSDILEDPLLSIEQEEFMDPSESIEDRDLKLYRQRIKLLREMKDLPFEESTTDSPTVMSADPEPRKKKYDLPPSAFPRFPG
jgi:hypothetical protein